MAPGFTPLVSVALALECEATCCDPAQLSGSGLSEPDLRTITGALCAVVEPFASWMLWRPQLRNPTDEMVLEAAINGVVDALVSFNQRDFGDAPEKFGIAVVARQESAKGRLSA